MLNVSAQPQRRFRLCVMQGVSCKVKMWKRSAHAGREEDEKRPQTLHVAATCSLVTYRAFARSEKNRAREAKGRMHEEVRGHLIPRSCLTFPCWLSLLINTVASNWHNKFQADCLNEAIYEDSDSRFKRNVYIRQTHWPVISDFLPF